MELNTERKLATIERIVSLKPIEGADMIEYATVRGWNVVVKKGEFVVGDLVIYCEIDSFLPSSLAPWLTKPGHSPKIYNGAKGERLRTVKLRGVVSQGLILPATIIHPDDLEWNDPVGTDVTELLGIQKWEPTIPAQLRGVCRSTFPSFGRKTDQPRLENFVGEVFVNNAGAEYEITLKLDGSSMSVYYNNGDVGVCSRNMDLVLDESNAGNSFVSTAKSNGLLDALQSLQKNIMVSGELMGPGIQGNREKLDKFTMFVFDVYDIDAGQYMSTSERQSILEELGAFGYKYNHVPIIEECATLESLGIVDVASSKVYVDRPSLNHKIAEGCVFKRKDGLFSFKSINNRFLLKCEE